MHMNEAAAGCHQCCARMTRAALPGGPAVGACGHARCAASYGHHQHSVCCTLIRVTTPVLVFAADAGAAVRMLPHTVSCTSTCPGREATAHSDMRVSRGAPLGRPRAGAPHAGPQRRAQRRPCRAARAGTLGRSLRRAPVAACRRPCWSGRRAGPPDGSCAPANPAVPAVPSVSV